MNQILLFDNTMIKDILFALELGFKVVSSFVICIVLGLKLDSYFNCKPICVLTGILIAFVCVMKVLLGAIKNE